MNDENQENENEQVMPDEPKVEKLEAMMNFFEHGLNGPEKSIFTSFIMASVLDKIGPESMLEMVRRVIQLGELHQEIEDNLNADSIDGTPQTDDDEWEEIIH
jgi:hypothetical protein